MGGRWSERAVPRGGRDRGDRVVKILHGPTGRVAAMRQVRGASAPAFLAFPPGSNEVKDARGFPTIESLALFVLSNPDWKVWLEGNGVYNDGQLNSDLI